MILVEYRLCLPPGMIIPFLGPIEERKIGEAVFIKDGKKDDILEVFSRFYEGELIKLVAANAKAFPIKVTPEHKILAIRKEDIPIRRSRKFRTYHSVIRDFKKRISWIPASELKAGDLVVFPKIKRKKCRKTLHLGKYGRSRKLRRIRIDKPFLRIIGLYLAEGFLGKREVFFSLGKHEVDLIKQLREDLAKLGLNSYVKETSTALVVVAYSVQLRNFLFENFGKGAENKFIPRWFAELCNWMIEEFFKAYLKGDGCEKEKDRLFSFTTTSLSLALGLKHLANRLGWHLSIGLYGEKGKSKILDREVNVLPQYHGKLRIKIKGNHSNRAWQDSKNFYYRLYEPEREFFRGYVYNLETKSQSYLVGPGFCVHNCEKFGWTLDELYSQPLEKIDAFLKIMDIEAQLQEREMRKMKNYAKWRRY